VRAPIVLGVLGMLGRDAGADSYLAEPDAPATHDRLLAFRIGGGRQTIERRDLEVLGLALAVEHRVYHQLRITGEYEYVWLGAEDPADSTRTTTGSGHRASLIVRHHLARTRILADTVRFFIDGELGGGLLLGSEPMIGTIVQPHALVGIRIGYDLIKLRRDTRASRVWEPDLTFRALATPGERVGVLIGVGMGWGD